MIRTTRLEKFSFITFLLIALIGGSILGVLVYAIESETDIQELNKYRPTLPTRLYDIKGRIISELFLHKREIISLDRVPPTVIAAFLSVEDNNFYSHFGIDFFAIFRAAIENMKHLSIVQGGSTLTQQLVKGLYTRGERSITRKIYEAALTLEVEKKFSKQEILEMYFNQIYLGHGAYGIVSAAKFYFNKKIEDLGIVEAAILAGLPKAPQNYSPFRNPHVCKEKSLITLKKIAEQGYITQKEAIQLHTDFWQNYWDVVMVTPSTINSFGQREDNAPYFTEYIRQYLEKKIDKEQLYSKGYRVYTTLDLDLQNIADGILKEGFKQADPIARKANLSTIKGVDPDLLSTYSFLQGIIPLPEIEKRYSLKNDLMSNVQKELSDTIELVTLALPLKQLNDYSIRYIKANNNIQTEDVHVQGAFLAMQPKTGRIVGMIGGREFKSSDQFNRALHARRQPGSAFKPFIYGAALEDRQVHSNMGFLDSPIYNIQPDGSMWAPTNYMGNYKGFVPLTKALALSMNLVSVQIYDMVGPDKIINFASRMMDISENRFQPNPSLALGVSELTPMELLKGYSVVANEGNMLIPHGVTVVMDENGTVLYNFESEIFQELEEKRKKNQLRIIEEGIAFILREMMRAVIEGTAFSGIREVGQFKGDAAGKTGTTSSWNDAWFSGFTTDLSAVIWLGMDQGSMTLGRNQSGGNIITPLWGKIINKYYEKEKRLPEPFINDLPPGVQVGAVTKISGRWVNPKCPQDTISTYIPAPIVVDGQVKSVAGEESHCDEVVTRSLLDIMQDQNNISDDEIGKKRSFDYNFDQSYTE